MAKQLFIMPLLGLSVLYLLFLVKFYMEQCLREGGNNDSIARVVIECEWCFEGHADSNSGNVDNNGNSYIRLPRKDTFILLRAIDQDGNNDIPPRLFWQRRFNGKKRWGYTSHLFQNLSETMDCNVQGKTLRGIRLWNRLLFEGTATLTTIDFPIDNPDGVGRMMFRFSCKVGKKNIQYNFTPSRC